MTMASSRIVLGLAIWLGSAFGQLTFSPAGQTASTPKREVSGVVINAVTGEPVRKALVSLQTGNSQKSAFSDDAGHFLLENVLEAMYGLQCQKPGYFGPGSGGQFQQINVSSANETITVKLVPAASVAGRVVDDKGQPVEGAMVQLLSEAVENGRKRWLPSQSGNTDEDGNYEIDNVQAGIFRLRLNMHSAPPFATASPLPQSRLPLDVYPAQYFPQGPDPSGAQALTLQGGQTEHADFTVTAVPGFRVKGVATPTKQGTFIRVEDASGNDVGLNASTFGATGRFLIAGVPNGAWRVIAQSFGSEEQLWGEQPIEVNNSDVVNLALHLEQVPNIPVEILNAPESGPQNLQLRLVADENNLEASSWRQSNYMAMTNQPQQAEKSPAMNFPNVFPGHYHFRSQSFGGSSCVDSLHYGSSDVEREGITVAGGQTPQPIQVSLRNDCASLEISFNLSDGVQNASVLILSDNPTFELPMMQGSGLAPIQVPGLTPGRYRLYAFDNADKLEYANPDVLSAFEAKEVTLDPSQKAKVTLNVVKTASEGSTVNGAR